MKTLMIFEDFLETAKVFVFEGDLRKYNGVFINSSESPHDLQDELNSLVYDSEGQFLQQPFKSLKCELPSADFLIICGFLP